jgi:hypothetical protein
MALPIMATLQFHSIMELVDFQMTTNTVRCTINDIDLTITGRFTEAELELAKAGYQAQINYATVKK